MALYNATLISHHVEEVLKKDQSGTYQALVLKINSNGEEKIKKAVLSYITQNNPNLLNKLATIPSGSPILIQTEGQFHQLKDVLLPNEPLPEPITQPKPKNTYLARGNAGGYKADPKKEASIIRQSCLKVAAEIAKSLARPDVSVQSAVSVIKEITLELERFVNEVQAVNPPAQLGQILPQQVQVAQPNQINIVPQVTPNQSVDHIPLDNSPF